MGAQIRFRIDGICTRYQTVPFNYKKALVSRIKIMSELDIAERRKPQDGKIKFKHFYPLDIELRVATIPTVGTEEDVVMRILTASEPIPLDSMGMNKRDFSILDNSINKPYGIFLVVGPTGSGKTTTLYSALTELNQISENISTTEDPVEYRFEGMNQIQVNPKASRQYSINPGPSISTCLIIRTCMAKDRAILVPVHEVSRENNRHSCHL
jgi:type II secretory ATPase GspE/PulE/Tfp pilus assembly ATPase PilB-like protein